MTSVTLYATGPAASGKTKILCIVEDALKSKGYKIKAIGEHGIEITKPELVRYCPECNRIGDFPDEARDCCPDGSHAAMVPAKFAEACSKTFKQLLQRSNKK